MPDADEVQNKFAEDVDKRLGLEIQDPGTGRMKPKRTSGCLATFWVPAVIAVVVALVLTLWAYSANRTDPGFVQGDTEAPETSSGTPQSSGQTGTRSDSGGQQTGSGAAGGHDESKPHVGQQWTPTYVEAGAWSVALAREEPLTESLEEGKNTLLVDVYVVNNGSADSRIDASFFSLRDGSGKVYPMLSVTSQEGPSEAPQGSPVYLEPTFEVPIDTQGLILRFSPAEAAGGKTVDIPLPGIAYSKPR
jgi:hypothetical protein